MQNRLPENPTMNPGKNWPVYLKNLNREQFDNLYRMTALDEEVSREDSSNPSILADTLQWGVKKYRNSITIADPTAPCA